MFEPDLRGHYEFRADTEPANTCAWFGSPKLLSFTVTMQGWTGIETDWGMLWGNDGGGWPYWRSSIPPVFPLRGSYIPATGEWNLGVEYYVEDGRTVSTGILVEGADNGSKATWSYLKEVGPTYCHAEVAGHVYRLDDTP